MLANVVLPVKLRPSSQGSLKCRGKVACFRPGFVILSLPFYPLKRKVLSKNLYTIILLTSLLLPIQAQQGVSFTATADARQVVQDGYVDVSFTLANANGTNFRPPPFDNFTVVSGPARATSTTIVNGRMTQEMSFVYTLQPKQTGKLTIGSATILVGKDRLTSAPITVEVVEGKAQATAEGGGREVFIRAEVNTTEAWVGQRIVLDYKLYTTIQIENYNVIEEADYQGFYAQDVRRYDSRLMREVVGGVQYVTKIIKRVLLYPQRAGELSIDPLHVQLGALPDDQRRRGFLFNRQLRRIPAITEPLAIQVRSLPAGAPAAFTGAVGNFQVSGSLEPRTITTDDALSLRLLISGNGDFKRIQAPEQDFPEAFEAYDPKVVRENTYELQGNLQGEKEFEYLLIPKRPGQYTLQPIFSWFDPDSARYLTYTGSFVVDVRQGSQSAGASPLPSATAGPDTTDIRYIKSSTTVYRRDQSFLGSTVFWVLVVIPFLLVGGAGFWRRTTQRRSSIDPALLRHRTARKVALRRLRDAKQLLATDDSRAFYNEVEHAMDSYVCDKLSIPQSELSREAVKQRLHSLGVTEEKIDRFLQMKQNCEVALYAGKDNSAAMQETYEQAVALIADIEASI